MKLPAWHAPPLVTDRAKKKAHRSQTGPKTQAFRPPEAIAAHTSTVSPSKSRQVVSNKQQPTEAKKSACIFLLWPEFAQKQGFSAFYILNLH